MNDMMPFKIRTLDEYLSRPSSIGEQYSHGDESTTFTVMTLDERLLQREKEQQNRFTQMMERINEDYSRRKAEVEEFQTKNKCMETCMEEYWVKRDAEKRHDRLSEKLEELEIRKMNGGREETYEERLTRNFKKSESEIEKLRQSNYLFQDKIDELMQENRRMKNKLAAKENEIEQVLKDFASKHEELNEKDQAIVKCQEHNDKIVKILLESEKKRKNEQEQFRAQLTTKEGENRKLLTELNDVQTEFDTFKGDLRASLQMSLDHIARVVSERNQIQHERLVAEKQFAEEKQNFDEAKEKLVQIEKDQELSRECHQNKIIELEKKIKELQHEVDLHMKEKTEMEVQRKESAYAIDQLKEDYAGTMKSNLAKNAVQKQRYDNELQEMNISVQQALGVAGECKQMVKCYIEILHQKEQESRELHEMLDARDAELTQLHSILATQVDLTLDHLAGSNTVKIECETMAEDDDFDDGNEGDEGGNIEGVMHKETVQNTEANEKLGGICVSEGSNRVETNQNDKLDSKTIKEIPKALNKGVERIQDSAAEMSSIPQSAGTMDDKCGLQPNETLEELKGLNRANQSSVPGIQGRIPADKDCLLIDQNNAPAKHDSVSANQDSIPGKQDIVPANHSSVLANETSAPETKILPITSVVRPSTEIANNLKISKQEGKQSSYQMEDVRSTASLVTNSYSVDDVNNNVTSINSGLVSQEYFLQKEQNVKLRPNAAEVVRKSSVSPQQIFGKSQNTKNIQKEGLKLNVSLVIKNTSSSDRVGSDESLPIKNIILTECATLDDSLLIKKASTEDVESDDSLSITNVAVADMVELDDSLPIKYTASTESVESEGSLPIKDSLLKERGKLSDFLPIKYTASTENVEPESTIKNITQTERVELDHSLLNKNTISTESIELCDSAPVENATSLERDLLSGEIEIKSTREKVTASNSLKSQNNIATQLFELQDSAAIRKGNRIPNKTIGVEEEASNLNEAEAVPTIKGSDDPKLLSSIPKPKTIYVRSLDCNDVIMRGDRARPKPIEENVKQDNNVKACAPQVNGEHRKQYENDSPSTFAQDAYLYAMESDYEESDSEISLSDDEIVRLLDINDEHDNEKGKIAQAAAAIH